MLNALPLVASAVLAASTYPAEVIIKNNTCKDVMLSVDVTVNGAPAFSENANVSRGGWLRYLDAFHVSLGDEVRACGAVFGQNVCRTFMVTKMEPYSCAFVVGAATKNAALPVDLSLSCW